MTEKRVIFDNPGRGHFDDTQRDILLQPVADWRVQELDGQSHLAGWDVIAHLNRVFGFEGWDKEILDLEPVYEHIGTREIGHRRDCNRASGCGCQNAKTVPACSVGYRCTLRLTVRNKEGVVVRVIDDTAMGTATNQRDMGDAHDLALKSAVTYALKRCAKDLGDQFGLSLYNKGQRSACVGQVAVYGGVVAQHEGNVEADGIHEGDDGFGHSRGEGEAAPPATEPDQPQGEPDPAVGLSEEEQAAVPPVREPEPAKPKADKPEATPPEPKPEAPQVNEELLNAWASEISGSERVDGEVEEGARSIKTIWREVAQHGALDALVVDLKTEKQATLRELMVRRVKEIEVAAA